MRTFLKFIINLTKWLTIGIVGLILIVAAAILFYSDNPSIKQPILYASRTPPLGHVEIRMDSIGFEIVSTMFARKISASGTYEIHNDSIILRDTLNHENRNSGIQKYRFPSDITRMFGRITILDSSHFQVNEIGNSKSQGNKEFNSLLSENLVKIMSNDVVKKCKAVSRPKNIILVEIMGESCEDYKIRRTENLSSADSIVVQLRSKSESMRRDSIGKCLLINGFNFDGIRIVQSEGFMGYYQTIDIRAKLHNPSKLEIKKYNDRFCNSIEKLLGDDDEYLCYKPNKFDFWLLDGKLMASKKGECEYYAELVRY